LKLLNNKVEIPKYARLPTTEESTRLKFLNNKVEIPNYARFPMTE